MCALLVSTVAGLRGQVTAMREEHAVLLADRDKYARHLAHTAAALTAPIQFPRAPRPAGTSGPYDRSFYLA